MIHNLCFLNSPVKESNISTSDFLSGRQTCHPSVDTDEPALPFGVQWPSAQAKAAAKALYMELLLWCNWCLGHIHPLQSMLWASKSCWERDDWRLCVCVMRRFCASKCSLLGTMRLSSQQCTQAERRSCYKHKCLLWHPDKNLDKEDRIFKVKTRHDATAYVWQIRNRM